MDVRNVERRLQLGDRPSICRTGDIRRTPYNMSTTEVGIFIGVAPLVGSAIGTISGGYFSDVIAKHMALRNNGIYEPEFRLVVLAPFLVVFCGYLWTGRGHRSGTQ